MKKTVFLSLLCMMSSYVAQAITLPAIIGDHMVLQRDAEVTLWGWGKGREPLDVSVSWDTSFHYKINIAPSGRWSCKVKTPNTAGPHSMTFRGYNTIEVKDILMGEVWFLTGQSNMEWSANNKIDNAEEAVASANFPEIRMFVTPHKTSRYPQDDCQGSWQVCTPEVMANFSAIGYFFGRDLHQQLKCPVGLVESVWGGTPVEIWTPMEVYDNDPILKFAAEKQGERLWGPVEPGYAYNAMINPLIPFKIAGTLWYQGEGNTVNARFYGRALEAMIESWRAAWGYNFPFYFVQIAPYSKYGDNLNGATVRYEQAKILDHLTNTEMVVVSDIGNLDNIHPTNKLDVGKRLAGLAFKNVYHTTDANVSSPRFQGMTTKGGEALVSFNGAENGLIVKGGELAPLFELQDKNGKWHNASSATVEGNKVRVKTNNLDKILNVRFAFKNDAVPPLFSKEGLPASCFTTEAY